MDIRTFKEFDREGVIELWKACNLTRPWNDPNKDIDRKSQFQPDLFFVGTVGEQIVASAMAGYDGHRGSVFYLAVHPSYQRLGYGQKLMTFIENALLKLGCPKLNIVIRRSNVSVSEFYKNLAYAEDDVISMGKRLVADG